MGLPDVDYRVNPKTGQVEMHIEGKPLSETDFSYNAAIGNIGFSEMLKGLREFSRGSCDS